MTTRRPGICMIAAKFYARSDMGGGLESSAHRLFQQLVAAGYRVTVLTRNYDDLPSTETIHGVTVRRFAVWGRSSVLVSLSFLAQGLWWLVRHSHEYDVVHCHQSYSPAVVGVLGKLLTGKPVIVKISTADAFSERRELERLPLFRLRCWLLRRVDRFVVVNALAEDEFKELGIPESRLCYVPNGVPIPQEAAYEPDAKARARQRLGLAAGAKIALFVGRLSEEKNLSRLVEAWAFVAKRHLDAQLLFVGDGGTFRNTEPALRVQVAQLGLGERVRFVGRVADVMDYLLAADVFALPSMTEGMSNALLEAMAAGLPIVASDVPGNAAIIRSGRTGLLVDRADAGALARAITRLFDSPEEAEALARAARDLAEQRYAISHVGSVYCDLYSRLCNGRFHAALPAGASS